MSLFFRSVRFSTSNVTSVCSDIFLLSLRLDVRLDLDLTDASSIKGEAPMYLIPKEADHAPIFLMANAILATSSTALGMWLPTRLASEYLGVVHARFISMRNLRVGVQWLLHSTPVLWLGRPGWVEPASPTYTNSESKFKRQYASVV